MDKKTFKKIKQTINKAKSIALFCHIDPDFDCLSSMYALRYCLIQLNKNVQMFTHEKFSLNKKAIFDESLVKIGEFDANQFDLVMTVDVPSIDRLGIYAKDIEKFEKTIKLDHHQVREEFAKIAYVNTEKSSCCEIIFDLIKLYKIKITPEIATILYCGLSSDTNSFVNNNTNLNSLETALELYKLGGDIVKASDVNTKMKTMAEFKLKKIFYRNVEIVNKEIAISTLTLAEMKSADAIKQDSEGFSSELLSFEGINISCCMTQKEENLFSCSLRSMTGYDVSQIAGKFNGGGHICAAGCKIKAKTIDDAKEKFLKEAIKYLKNKAKETNESSK